MKLHKRIIKSLFIAAFISKSVSASTDIDQDKDGLVDEGQHHTNVLLNGDFAQSGDSWDTQGLSYIVAQNRNGIDSAMLGSNYSLSHTNGSASQTISLSSLGFSDVEALDSVLANTEMKVVFGAWHSTADMSNNVSSITLMFLDENGNAFGESAVLSNAGTNDYEWKARQGEAVIPVGTRALTYKVEFTKSGNSGARVKLDDAHVYIQQAVDIDQDAVLDYKDIDKDNDGYVDEDSYMVNVLSNGDFTHSGESWDTEGLSYVVAQNRNGIDSVMLGSSYSGIYKEGDATQVVTMDSMGFKNEATLDEVLASSHLKVVFGAWHSTSNINTSFSKVTLSFIDENGNSFGDSMILSLEGTGDYAWKERLGEAIIPVGTRALSYKLELKKAGYSGHLVKIDDTFIYLHDMSDHDNDGLGHTQELIEGTNPYDSDTDGDGISDGYEYLNGLNPTNRRDGELDLDSDGFTNFEEFSLGTDPNTNDSDNDGIPDREDNFPSKSEVKLSGIVDVVSVSDIDEDSIADFIIIESDDEGVISATMRAGGNIYLSPETVVTWENKFQSPQVMVLDDITGNGIPDVGVFGLVKQTSSADLKPMLEVRDPKEGDFVRFNWPANWIETSVIQLDDINGDGYKEIALQGRFLKGGLRPQLFVKDGVSGSKLATFSFPNLFKSPQWHQHSDMNNDGVRDISLSGQLLKNSKTQVKVVNAKVSNDKLASYNFPNKWDDVSWNELADINGDSVVDWGLLGKNKEDGRIQLFTKSGNVVRGSLGIFAWPEGMQNVAVEITPDINFDGVPELLLSGFRADIQKHQISVKSGSDRNEQLLRATWANNYSEVSYQVLNDLKGDGMVAVSLLGRDNRANQYILSITQISVDSSLETVQLNLGADWSKPPAIVVLEDENSDGIKEILFVGKNLNNELKLSKMSPSF
ncbi:MAG: hypothetical protein CL582_09695 [Alteromonadaceae bacterium]|nr:hypothetical protein [Alteromonadaceae bacterium]